MADQIVEILRIAMLGLGIESGTTSLFWFWTVITSAHPSRLEAVKFAILGTACFQFGVAVLSTNRLWFEDCCYEHNHTLMIISDSLIATGQVLAIVAGCHFFLWHRWPQIFIGLALRLIAILFVAQFLV